MGLGFNLALVTAALLFEAVVGYPDFVYRLIRHPVVWMGALIDWLDSRLNRSSMPEAKRRLNGALALIVLLLAALLPAAAIQFGLLHILPKADAVIFLAIAASTFIAQVSLYDHVRDVAEALEGQGLDGAREAVAEIVGRDTSTLDEAGVARAAIESLAENFSDGVVAPSLWCALARFPGHRWLQGRQHRGQHDRAQERAFRRLRICLRQARRLAQSSGLAALRPVDRACRACFIAVRAREER